MTPAMYILVRKDLRMSTGKACAQTAQAAACALRLKPDANLTNQWFRGGHHMVLVMECRDREHLLDAERYINDRGFQTAMQVDEGHTEVDPITPTCFATEIVDKDWGHARETFSSFKLYRDQEYGVDVVALAKNPSRGTCKRPPAGWYCSLYKGHAGPCPTYSERPQQHGRLARTWDWLKT